MPAPTKLFLLLAAVSLARRMFAGAFHIVSPRLYESVRVERYGWNAWRLTQPLGSNPPARQRDIAKLSINLAQSTFEEWASRSNVDLFAEASDLLLRIIFATCFGEHFAQSHENELFSIMQVLHEGLTNPWSRLLPLWASPSGRGIDRAQRSLQRLLAAEVQDRLKDLNACGEARDYLSFLLVSNSAKGFVESDNDLAAHFVCHLRFLMCVRKGTDTNFVSIGRLFYYGARKHGRHIRLDGTSPPP